MEIKKFQEIPSDIPNGYELLIKGEILPEGSKLWSKALQIWVNPLSNCIGESFPNSTNTIIKPIKSPS